MSAINMLGIITPNGHIGLAHPSWHPEDGSYTLPLPAGFELSDLEFLRVVDRTLVINTSAKLVAAKAVRIARIKAEAAERISALDWRLERAKEREDAGWTTLREGDEVRALREAIRRSSNVAEVAVQALGSIAEVLAFTWAVDVVVAVPRRLTHTKFAERFPQAEFEAIVQATVDNTTMRAWWEKFNMAREVNLDDTTMHAGLMALELVGVIAEGRTVQVLA